MIGNLLSHFLSCVFILTYELRKRKFKYNKRTKFFDGEYYDYTTMIFFLRHFIWGFSFAFWFRFHHWYDNLYDLDSRMQYLG